MWAEEALSVAKFEGWLSPGGSVERSQFVGWLSMRTDTRGWPRQYQDARGRPRQCRVVVEAEDGLEVSFFVGGRRCDV